VPDRFNFVRDVVEALADDPKRRALTFSGKSGIIEPRTFRQLAEGASHWASVLGERGVGPGDRVLVLLGGSAAWIEVILGCIKAGAVTVPCSPRMSAPALEVRVAATGASLIVADHASDRELAQMSFAPDVVRLDDGDVHGAADTQAGSPTHDTSSRDIAFILSSSGTASGPRAATHTHGSTFATRVQAEHWLDATRGDAVWCTADTGSAQAIWTGLLGPWSRGAELVVHDGEFDPLERLDLIHRLGVTILCQSPAEYRALADLRRKDLERYQSRRLRRLISTGDYLEPDVVAVFEEAWGMTIHDGYGQVETNVVVANGADAGFKPGSLGLPLPGHQVAVVDGQGNELPPGIEGDLAVRGRPPTLFAGYWESSDETKEALGGDWYATGDVATRDEDGFLWFVARAADVIASRGRAFGPHEVERTLREHASVAKAAVVGVRDLERGGHFVRAFVVLAPRAVASVQLEAELRQHVADSLPEQQVPREVEFVDSLPTTASGKLRRDDLREMPVVGRPLWEAPAVEPEVPSEASVVEMAPSEPAPATPEPQGAVPEPVLHAPEPVVEVAPVLEPEPVVAPEPPREAVAETETRAAAVASDPATVEIDQPEPRRPSMAEPETLPEYVVESAPEVEPVVMATPEPPPPVEVDPGPLPEYVVDPEHVSDPALVLQHEPEPDEEPELGPLPDFVVDPERPEPVLEPVPAPTMRQPDPEPEPPAPAPEPESPLAGLGLKPVTEFPRRESSPQRDTPPGSRRSGVGPDGRDDRDRSLGDPGDEPEEIGWMQGLSSRLSAYSLGSDEETPEANDDEVDEIDENEPEPRSDETGS
jgi:acetyl-CoA synthetase/medium-chain acyl-CoA synthetase